MAAAGMVASNPNPVIYPTNTATATPSSSLAGDVYGKLCHRGLHASLIQLLQIS